MHPQFVMINTNALACFDNPYEQAIFIAIKSYFPNAFPSLTLIAKKTNLCRATVIKYLKSLRAKGILSVFKHNGRVNRYQFNQAFITPLEAEKQARVHKNKYLRLVKGAAQLVGSFLDKMQPVQSRKQNKAPTSIASQPLTRDLYLSKENYEEEVIIPDFFENEDGTGKTSQEVIDFLTSLHHQ